MWADNQMLFGSNPVMMKIWCVHFVCVCVVLQRNMALQLRQYPWTSPSGYQHTVSFRKNIFSALQFLSTISPYSRISGILGAVPMNVSFRLSAHCLLPWKYLFSSTIPFNHLTLFKDIRNCRVMSTVGSLRHEVFNTLVAESPGSNKETPSHICCAGRILFIDG